MRLGLYLGLGNRRGGAGAFVPNFFVDSANGDDGNDGTTLATAYETLGQAESSLSASASNLGIVAGSEWQEQISTPNLSFDFRTTGSGDVPYVDAAGEVTETWAQPDSGTYPNVWAVDITHGFTSGGNQSRLPIWEDGELLTRVTSISECNTTPGSFYSPSDESLASVATATVNVHATDSGNPNSNGFLYEVSRRQYAVEGAFGGSSGQRVVGPLKVGRQSHNDGAITLGQNSEMSQVLAIDGHKHNALQESGSCRNSVFFNAQEVNGYLHVYYTSDGSGKNCSYSGCGFVGDVTGDYDLVFGVYCHDIGGAAHDLMDVDSSWFIGLSTCIDSAAVTCRVTNSYMQDSRETGIAGGTGEFSRNLVNRTLDDGSSQFDPQFSGTLTIQNNGFYITGITSGLQSWYRIFGTSDETTTIQKNVIFYDVDQKAQFIDTAATSTPASFVLRDNIFLVNHSQTFGHSVIEIGDGSIDTDYNIYWMGSGTSVPRFRVANGTNYDFSGWQGAGYDVNSILIDENDITLDDLFVGGASGLANGDFRLRTDTGLTFGDGTPIHERAGISEYYDWSSGSVQSGAPSRWPVVPSSEANSESYISDPSAWSFYP